MLNANEPRTINIPRAPRARRAPARPRTSFLHFLEPACLKSVALFSICAAWPLRGFGLGVHEE